MGVSDPDEDDDDDDEGGEGAGGAFQTRSFVVTTSKDMASVLLLFPLWSLAITLYVHVVPP
jgi:hypothetical protein